jgi:hypothetical protein
VVRALRRATKSGVRLVAGGPAPQFDVVVQALAGHVAPQRLGSLTLAASRGSRSVRFDRLARSAAVARSLQGRDLLVKDASKGAFRFVDIQRAIDDCQSDSRHHSSTDPLWHIGVPAALNLAWLLSVQHLTDRDRSDSLALYDWARGQRPRRRLPTRHQRAYIELLIAAREYSRAAAELEGLQDKSAVIAMLQADIANPFVAPRDGVSEDAWLATVNQLWEDYGLEPITLGPLDAKVQPYDRLLSEPISEMKGRERVTVVMSAFRPDARMLTALRSVVASTWTNLEVLVCDDASGPDYDSVLDAAAALDPRVTVIRMPHNGGTYRIRNHALTVATGDFITFHDSDDWMHPQRLETQAVHLIAHRHAIANASRSARVTETLQFSHTRNLGAQICEPSLMLRRERAVELVGYFDTLRKGADAEYRLRLEAATGAATPVVGAAPLTLQLIVEGSLSNTDIVRHWFHADRRIHRSCFDQWHLACAARGETPRLADDVPRTRHPVYAPPGMLGTKPRTHYDVVVATNWLEDGTWGLTDPALEQLIEKLLTSGHTVAITHVPDLAPLFSMRLALSGSISRMLNETALEYVNPDDPVTTTVLAVREGERLEAKPPGILTQRTLTVSREGRTRPDLVATVTDLLAS